MKTIGVIGLGSIGLRHATNLINMGHKVYGFDPKDSQFDNYSGVECATLKKVTEADAIVIASPTALHLEHIQESQNRPTFVEKPIAHVLPMYIDHVLMVGNNLRFHSCIKQVKGWMADAIIGHPIWANFIIAQYNVKYQKSVILNWGAHEVDLALYLLGPAEVGTCIGNRDIADVVLLHKSGCRTAIHMDYLTHPEERGFIIAGTDGLIKCNLVDRETYIMTDDGITKSFVGEDNWDMNYYEEMQAFIDRIDGKKTLGATGEEGLACLELLLQAEKIAGITQ